jgi:hypothetical protein
MSISASEQVGESIMQYVQFMSPRFSDIIYSVSTKQ